MAFMWVSGIESLMNDMSKPTTVEEYISQVQEEVRDGFIELHRIILETAPEARSVMSYGMPAIKLEGIVVYYATWEKHYAIYPMPSAMKAFAAQTKSYKTSKSTIQFPHGEPIPTELVRDIVAFRMQENKEKAELKKVSKRK
jgi:uncharacterized protein YdhG (YjbR/CyaY superfamily)